MTAYITLFKSTSDDRGFKWALLFSCLLHGIILVFLIVSSHENSGTVYYSPVYSVNLVDMPIGTPSKGSDHQKPSGNTQRRMEKISLWDGGSSRINSQTKTISEREHPILTFTQKEATKSSKQKQPEREHVRGNSSESTTGSSDNGIETVRTSGVAGGGPPRSASDMRYAHYYKSIWERIQNAWAFPSYDKSKSELEAILIIKIARNGKIVETRFEKRSGDSSLDSSAVRAIRKADPLPPLPESFSENFMELGIRFMPSGVM